jgi:hypothetical protein
MAKKLVYDYTFTPSTNTIVLNGNVARKRLLLITNVTSNIIVFNFADSTKTAASVTFDYLDDTTTIVLNFDCSNMSISDTLQIFIDEDGTEFRPSPTYTDPVSKFRVSQGQTLIDTDFEYGLQATKWETIELVNNIPGFFSRSGDTPLGIINVNATFGEQNITVFSSNHGLTIGTPIDVRGLNQPALDGSYIITSVPDPDSFVFEGRIASNITGTISGAYTSITPGKFYAGSDVNFSSISTDGNNPSTITVTTRYPSGFVTGNEFYITNSIATSNLLFDASAIDPTDTLVYTNTVDPTATSARNTSDQLAVNIYDYQSSLGNVYLDTTQVSTTTITATAHGFSNLDAVAWVQISGAKPTAITDRSMYYARVVNPNQFQLSTTTVSAVLNVATGMTGIATIMKGYYVTSFASSTDRFALNTAMGAASQAPHMIVSSAATGTGIAGAQTITKTETNRIFDGQATGLATANGASWGSLAFNLQVSTTSVQFGFNGTTFFNGTSNAFAAQTGFIPLTTVAAGVSNTINDSAHGLTNNELVTYNNGGGTNIGGITSGTQYYVDLVNTNRFGLKTSTAGARINFTGYTATGTAHTFAATRVNPTKDTIFLAAHGLSNGEQLQYNANSETVIGGLSDLNTYYIVDATTDRFRLSDVISGTGINLTAAGTGTQIFTTLTEGAFDGVYTVETVTSPTSFTLENDIEIPKLIRGFDPSTEVSTVNSTITIPAHRYTTGSIVTYDNGTGSNIGGLAELTEYYVIRVTSSIIKLAESAANATAGVAITLSSVGSGTSHSLTSDNIAGEIPRVGTVSIISGSKTVVGSGTNFTRVFKVGDPILIDTGSAIFETTISAISSDTELSLLEEATATLVGLTYLSLTGFFVKSNSFSIHRPFDGGVEINAGYGPQSQIVRQTRRYFRYQSGKGLSCQVAINFNPGFEIMGLTCDLDATQKTKCRRDIGYILDGAAYDVPLGTNYNAIFLGHAEVYSLDLDWYVLETIRKAQDAVLALPAVSGNAEATSRANAFFNEVLDISENGNVAASALEFTNPTGGSANAVAAKDRLLANLNNGFITAEINAYVAATFPASTHDVDKLEQDITISTQGFMYDVLYGGTQATYTGVTFLLNRDAGNAFGVASADIAAYTGAYQRLSVIIQQIVLGTTVTKTSAFAETQDTSGSNATATEASTLDTLAEYFENTIAGQSFPPGLSKINPVISWADDSLETASASIVTNKNSILDSTTQATKASLVTRYVHGLSVGTIFSIRGAEDTANQGLYNGIFVVGAVPTATSIEFDMLNEPINGVASGFPEGVARDWSGAFLRTGMYDFQNGPFWEYDGTTLRCCRRNSTKQIGGTVEVNYRSALVTGTGTSFTEQLAVNDMIVIRGQSYKVVNIANSSTLFVSPPYRGVDSTNVIVCKTIDIKIPQTEWTIDRCDGTGVHGYALDVTKIQMAYIDYSWYGAGKIRFGFKGAEGEVIYVHEFKHNNRENEAFMRSGNLPARYEIENFAQPTYAPSLAHWGTTIQMDGGFDEDNAYLFTASSNFLTFTGTSASVTGGAGINYTYVNSNGTTTNDVTTFNQTGTISTVNVTTADSPPQTRDSIVVNNHGFSTAQLVQYDNASGVVIGGLAALGYYYVIVIDVNRFALSLTEPGARTNIRINLTTQGNVNQRFRSQFRFVPTLTNVPGYGDRVVHRFVTDTSGFAAIGNVSFGTPITSTAIATRGSAKIFKVTGGAGGIATVDFFFVDAPSTLVFPSFPSLASNNFIPSTTSAVISHTVGQATPVPSVIPVVSVRLGPSVDSGLIGSVGQRDIINRMQLDLASVGILTTHDIEIRLILNAELDNVGWSNVGRPSLSQVISHIDGDVVTSGTTIFTFRASGNSPDAAGKRTARSEAFDIGSILSLGNSIIGGDNVFPDGPDILTIAVSPLDTSTITVNTPFSTSGRISWSESQA